MRKQFIPKPADPLQDQINALLALKVAEKKPAKCAVCDCQNHSTVKGLCWSHYMRNRRHGTPTGGTTDRGAAQAFFDAIPEHGSRCIFWPFSKDSHGSAKLVMGDGRTDYAARRICERTHGSRGCEYQAAHSCGNGHLGCVAPWHLSWKTRSENESDKIAHGTYGRKLNEDQVREIRRLFPSSTKVELASRFGVTRQAIHWIVERKGWAHVE